MSKKVIISEIEKSEILSLYESVPPPSESVLVTNKNPFKYSEYESARRTYNENLKDGDLFYSPNMEKIKQYFNEQLKKIGDEFTKNLYNKTIRYYDNLIKILPIDLNESSNFGGSYTNSLMFLPVKLVIISSDGQIEKELGIYDVFSSVPKYEISLNPTKYFDENFTGLRFIKKDSDDKYRIYRIIESQILNSTWYKLLNNKISLSTFPDTLFEIRKIQRFKTDF